MSNSSLVSYTKISPNTWGLRTHTIDTVTIHCVVGQCTVESLGNTFAPRSRKASSNYGIGFDGRIGMYCEEKNASQCSSNKANDNRAITIEVASDTKHPYRVTDAAYKALIDLLVDICKRNPGIGTLKWQGNKKLVGQVAKQNMTVHRWFANKACPGDYLYNLHPQIAKEVNARLGAKTDTVKVTEKVPFPVRVTITDLNIRTCPGTNYSKVGKKTGKGVFTIVEVQNGKGALSGWGKLKSGLGWISLDYATRI